MSAQLFLAGESEWRPAFDNPALATFAEALVAAHTTLAGELEAADRPALVISAVVKRARRALFDEDYSPALPVAERALRAVLIETLQAGTPLADVSGPEAAQAWQHNRGAPEDLVQRFVGQMFGQWASHVASRDTARLVEFEGRDAATVREFADALSNHVVEVAQRAAPARRLSPADLGGTWQDIIDAVFVAGRRLEPHDGA